jgi:hypothetical protein|eukprot:scaffold6860_cov297-Chaetoceros_neogracile.AAC.5
MGSFKLLALFHVLVIQCLLNVSSGLQVAVIGATGNIGRAAIAQLSRANVDIKCLLRHDITSEDRVLSASAKVAASLASLKGVTMVMGDVTNKESIAHLIEGCDAVLCLQGPPKPNPIASLLPFLSNPNAPSHPRMTNFVGMQNVIQAVQAQTNPTCKRIVRITGKGEQPFSFFTILINMLGCMAKAWNYEGEQLLRNSGIDYTIIRPGLLKDPDDYQIPTKAKMVKDNGQDLKVSPVTYDQIANVCINALNYDNCAKTTLTVMNVDEGQGYDEYTDVLPFVNADELDKRYPDTLLEKHRMGARIGLFGLCVFIATVLNGLKAIVGILL